MDMGFPAARLFTDKVVGFPHCHVPGHPPGPPIPTPIIGLLIYPDPLSLVFGRPKVFVNGLPAAIAGDQGFHVFCCGPNKFEIKTGSSTVNIEGSRAVRTLDLTKHCELGMPAIPPIIGNRGMVVSGSPNVLIGGFPLPDFTVMAMGFAFKGLAKLKNIAKSSKLVKNVSKKIHKTADKIMNRVKVPQKVRDMVHSSICTLTGHPVDVATGKVIVFETEFELPFYFPLEFKRIYKSTSGYNGPLGYGWHHNFDLELVLINQTDDPHFVFRDEEGRYIDFDYVSINEYTYNKIENSSLANHDDTIKISSQDKNYIFTRSLDKKYILTEIQDNYQNSIKLNYLNGRLIELICGETRKILLIYKDDKIMDILLKIDKYNYEKKLVRFEYYNNDLISAIDINGDSKTYTYKNHLLIKETSKTGITYYFKYDNYNNNGYCIETWGNNDAYKRIIKYDKKNRITVAYDSKNNPWTYRYNEFGFVEEYIDPNGNVFKIIVDENLNVIREINRRGYIQYYEYDRNGNLIYEQDNSGNITYYEYDDMNMMTKMIEPDGGYTFFKYDQNGNLVKTRNSLNEEFNYKYDEHGSLFEEIDPNGNSTKYEYNSFGQILKIIDAKGNITEYRYDMFGLPMLIIDEKNIYKLYHDDGGQFTGYDDKYGVRSKYEYDPEGKLTKFIDALGNITVYKYGVFKDPLIITNPQNMDVLYIYDNEGNLIRIINEKEEEAYFYYDSLNRLIKEVYFNGAYKEFRYDPEGNIVHQSDSNGNIIEYLYDPNDNVIEERVNGKLEVKYEYDKKNEVICAENRNSKLTFVYNSVGQLINEIQNDIEINYSYDKAGNKIRTKCSTGLDIKYKYDKLNLLEYIECNNNIETFRYDSGFNIIKQNLSNGVSCIFEFDHLDRMTYREFRDRTDNTIINNRYEFNNLDNIIKVIGDRVWKYEYDKLERVIISETNRGYREVFSYDMCSNLLNINNKHFEYQNGNILTKTSDSKFQYDQNGNMIKEEKNNGEVILYQYDYDSRLIKICSKNNTIEYKYDPIGRRIEKNIDKRKIRYIWDEDSIISEVKPDEIIEYIYHPFSYNPILQYENKIPYYYCHDYLGTPLEILDKNGKIIESQENSVFGKKINSATSKHNKFSFPGQYVDNENGLCYSLFRYYSPELCRFITPDPLGIDSELNQYLIYPLNYIDPYGLKKNKTSGHNRHTGRGTRMHDPSPGGPLDRHMKTNRQLRGVKYELARPGQPGPDVRILPGGKQIINPATGKPYKYLELKPDTKSGLRKMNRQIRKDWANMRPKPTKGNVGLIVYPRRGSPANVKLKNRFKCK